MRQTSLQLACSAIETATGPRLFCPQSSTNAMSGDECSGDAGINYRGALPRIYIKGKDATFPSRAHGQACIERCRSVAFERGANQLPARYLHSIAKLC